MGHGYLSSGILPVQYRRFTEAAGIGTISKQKQKTLFEVYKFCVQEEYAASTQCAVDEEKQCYPEGEGIEIETEARHGWRKNAKDSSVECLGDRTHKVLSCQNISKVDDKVTQRHEKIGTVRLYEHFESTGTKIKVHAHDINLSINKYVRDHEKETTSQNDLWHGVKGDSKAILEVGKGAKAWECGIGESCTYIVCSSWDRARGRFGRLFPKISPKFAFYYALGEIKSLRYKNRQQSPCHFNSKVARFRLYHAYLPAQIDMHITAIYHKKIN
jgi:hypothetical protein